MYSFLLGFFCFFQLLSPVDSDEGSVRFSACGGAACSSDLEETADPAGDFAELLQTVSEVSPGLYRRICSLPRQALLEALMSAAGSQVRRVSDPDRDASPGSERTFAVFPGRLLEEKRVFYLRVDGLSESSLSSAGSELHQSLASSSPSAMILDLRNADPQTSREEYDFVPGFLRLLSEEPKIAEWYGPRPLTVLISHKTSGAAAFLAACLASRKNGRPAVTVGSATSGSSFPVETRKVCGAEWRIPLISEADAESKIPTGPLEPGFAVDGRSGQIDFRKLGDPRAISADAALRASLDLVLSLSVLKTGPAAKTPQNVVPDEGGVQAREER